MNNNQFGIFNWISVKWQNAGKSSWFNWLVHFVLITVILSLILGIIASSIAGYYQPEFNIWYKEYFDSSTRL